MKKNRDCWFIGGTSLNKKRAQKCSFFVQSAVFYQGKRKPIQIKQRHVSYACHNALPVPYQGNNRIVVVKQA